MSLSAVQICKITTLVCREAEDLNEALEEAWTDYDSLKIWRCARELNILREIYEELEAM